MKNSNLLNRLLSYSHEKQKLQRFARYAAMLILLLTIGVGEMWAWGSYTFSGDYFYFKAQDIRDESGTKMDWMKDGAYARTYGATSGNETGGTTYDYYRVEVDATNHIYRTVFPTGTWNLIQLVRCSSVGANWTWSYKMDAANFANGKNYLWDDGKDYHWSYFAEDAYVIFDNSNANWGTGSNYIYFTIGRDGYTSGGDDYKMRPITHTNLYQYHIQKWADYDRFRFVNTDNYTQHNTTMQPTPTCDGYTAILQNSSDLVFDVNTGNLFSFSGTNGSDVTKNEMSDYTELNKTITIKEKFNSSGVGTFVEVDAGIALGSISAAGYAFNSWITCEATPSCSITKETSTFSANADFGYTSTVTLTAGATKEGKAFVGWYKNDGTLIGTNTTETFTVTGDETVYAYYKDATYTITYKDQGGSAYSGSNEGSLPSSYTYGTGIPSLTNGVKSGFRFGGWYTDSECTEGPVTSISTTDTGNKTFYAQWLEVPVINDVALSSTVVTGGTTITATPDITDHGQTVTVCWKVLDAEGEPLASQPTFTPGVSGAVSFAAPTTPGAYMLQATLREGSDCEGDILDTEIKTFDVESQYTVSITNGTGSSTVGTITTATVNPAAAPDGKKFKQWEITGTYTTSGALTDRSFTFNATSNISITATYEDRDYVKIYFKAPGGDWNPPYAYVWNSSDDSKKNAAYPGEEMSTETVNCVEYYYYKYYIDNNGEGSDLTAQAEWDKVIFNKGENSNTEYPGTNWNKTKSLTVANGHFYFYHCATNSTGSAYGTDWYLRGNFNGTADWSSWDKPITINCATNEGYVDMAELSSSYDQFFRIYQISTEKEFRISTENSNTEVSMGTGYTLQEKNSNADYFRPIGTTDYRFTLNVATPSAPVLTVRPASDEDHIVNFAVSGQGSITTPGTGSQTIHRYTTTTITAQEYQGFRFSGWTVTGTNAANVNIANTSAKTTTVYATGTTEGVTITANFDNSNIIYFDNSSSRWNGDIYVYMLKEASWWENMDEDGQGPGLVLKNKKGYLRYSEYGKMTRIDGTDVYYYAYTSHTGYVAFTKGDYHESAGVYGTSAAYRADFNECLPLYIASGTWTTTNSTGYHNAGYWKRYRTTESGFSLWIDVGSSTWVEHPFTNEDPTSNVYTTSVDFSSANTVFGYNVARCSGGKKLRRADYGGDLQDSDSDWPRELGDSDSDGGLRTSSAGTYNFTLSLTNDHIYMTVEYPVSKGDYRVVLDNGSKIHSTGRVLRARTEERTDTISVFIDHTKAASNTLYIDTCSYTGDPLGWTRIEGVASASMSLNKAPYNTKTGTYLFAVTRTRRTDVKIVELDQKEYDGDYYIRTDVADGRWTAYMSTPDNKMHYSPISLSKSGYNYYFTKWAKKGKNMHYTIANDYSPCISDTLTSDATYLVGANHDELPDSANVRFTWNSETNGLSRAFINGSSMKNRFLVLTGDSKTFTEAGVPIPADVEKGLAANELEFEDKGNWVYELNIRAQSSSEVNVTAKYNNQVQSFISDQSLITSTDESKKYLLRAIYDFKTNQLVTAWLPDSDPISGEMSVTADMMLIRHAQDAATQLNFSGGSISEIKTMIGAIEFRKDSIVGRVSHFRGDTIGTGRNRANRELMLYISFPFDVAVQDIYGIGQLNKEWYLQYYDGADRARRGFFRGDGTTTFWKYMTLADTLRANVGYSLLLDNDYFNSASIDGDNVWHNIDDGGSVYLYFPSVKELHEDSIISSGTKTIRVPEHKHTSGRTFVVESRTLCHDFTDSDWNMMGVPLFQNQTGLEAYFDATADPTDWPAEGKGYFYEWDSLGNNFEIHTAVGYTFKSMHGYMVQYSGSVSFTGASIQPASSVVARRAQKSRENYTMELQLLKENKRVSRTYIELREEACDTFALDEDVYMVYTSHPADLYTYAGNYDVSANVLSMDNHSIPVGIEVHKAGSYTFSMPENFSGAAILVDTQTGTRTNLALSDYIVTLPKGICDGRFYIEIDLNKMPTAIDGVEGGSLKDGKAHKFIENGLMYILQNGAIFDARGNRVK